MFIIFAFIALSAAADAVDPTKAKYLIQKDGYEKKVIILKKCSPTSDQQTRTKYEAESATKYKKHVYPGTDSSCSGAATSSTSLDLVPTEGTKYEYAETLPNHIAYRVQGLSEDCSVQIENELTIYMAECVKDTSKSGAQSVKVTKDTNNKLMKNYFSDDNCQTAITQTPTEEIAACGSCGSISSIKSSLKCEKRAEESSSSGGTTNQPVDYKTAKYLVEKGTDERSVIVLNICGKDEKNNDVKYEAVSATQYKKVEYENAGCTGNVVMTVTIGIQAPTEYEYTNTLPTYLGYYVYGNAANCGQLANVVLRIYDDKCLKRTLSSKNSKSEIIVKENNKLVKKYFSDEECKTVIANQNQDLGTCGQCVEEYKKKITCGVFTPPTPAPAGGVDYKTAKYAIDKEKRVGRSVLELRKCSKMSGGKFMKAEGTSATKYKICTYTDDKCTAGETCQPEAEDMEFVNDLPKHIAYNVVAADTQCATLTDASFTIYSEECVASTAVTGGTHEKGVIEGGKFKIKSYTDDKCTKENSNNKERDVQECGKCKADGTKGFAMKCQAYGSNSNGSIQTFVLFALTILFFLF